MTERLWWRMAALVVVAIVAGLLAAFNTGERVALNLGFTMLYRVPLVPLIFLVFIAGMTTMFLVGLRHDARVRRALRDAGLGGQAMEVEERAELDDVGPERARASSSEGGERTIPAGVEVVAVPDTRYPVVQDDPSASWAETRAVDQPPEPLPPDQEPRDPP